MQPRLPPQGQPTYPEESSKKFSENLKVSRRGKLWSPACSHCGKPPSDDERFSKCARCKAMVYCSRQCQKKDWPDHKSSCTQAEKQRDFVIKCMLRISDSKEFKDSLGLALAEEFYETLRVEHNTKKMWVAAAHVCLLPRDDKDFDELESPDIPMESLLPKPMSSRFMISKVEDGSNKEDYPLDERAHAIWQHTRDALDKADRFDSHSMLVCFVYHGNIFYVVSKAVHPYDLRDVGISRAWGEVGDWREKRMQILAYNALMT
ncbi:hypothetical protein GALMADRAFT_160447 [Galerina marginata CBS 339.88]|uniref:MYND-type domain-containing protein n=1 Tax=Galerina marginata (strain CBS 339.88) TaxID=685588 RepID=A0A067SEV9_GALM3|nr:hypothetical protein GALMADRAFT_160447 [Galerina marginata CBS 339.88]